MRRFLSCDWGTSAFRLRVVEADTLNVLAETTNAQGISASFDWWQRSGKGEEGRLSFYQSFILAQIKKLEEQSRSSLEGMPLIISGMASSRIGMVELPYKILPFHTDGHDLSVKLMDAASDFKHPLVLISGARTGDDIMRGEETQLIGCEIADRTGGQLFIFPGTHSKHVKVENGQATTITTYMTGEFFELLTRKSILASDVEEGSDPMDTALLNSFEKGVLDSINQNILHSAFQVRSNHLLGKSGKKENYYYLSGFLVGTEMKELTKSGIPLTLVANEGLKIFYAAASRVLGIDITVQPADAVIIKGHQKMYDQYARELA